MSTSRKQRKETQRERLLAGMLAAAVRRGYSGANVAEVIALARVSRPTFYEYFSDKDHCFLAVHREISEQLLKRVRDAVDAAPPERAVQAGIGALILSAEAKPERARFLVNEALAAGAPILDQRDRTVHEIVEAIDTRRAQADPGAPTPDMPLQAVVGGICGLLAPRLRRNEHDLHLLADEISRWIDSYSHPTEAHRWRTLAPGPPLRAPAHVSEMALRPPPPLPPGRPAISAAEVARNQRERIVYATAEVAAQKGYTETTVADITRNAGVDRRVFYANFRDKQEAFLAAHELGFQQTMAVCASAFFSGSSWPERVWSAIHAGTHFEATYQVLAHIGYVEAYAVGSPAVQRVEDSHAAFAIFLQEGYAQTSDPPPRSAGEGITQTIYRIGYHHARRRQLGQLPSLTPLASYLVLTPFIGREAANELVDEMSAATVAQAAVRA